DASANGFQFGVEQYSGIAAELDQRTVFTANALSGTNHYCVINFAFLDASAGGRIFDTHFDDVTDGGITALRAAQHLDAHNRACASVVGHVQRGLHLDHDFSCSNLDAQRTNNWQRHTTSFGPVRFGIGQTLG